MKFYQLSIALRLKRDIYHNEVTEKLSILFNKSMLYHYNLESIHELNQYKFYTFEGLLPFEKDKIYKSGKNYTTSLRCIDEKMAEEFKMCLKQVMTNEFDVMSVNINALNIKRNIKQIYTVTPTIATIDGKPWTNTMSIDIIKSSINNNLINKLKTIKEIEYPINHDMIEEIEVKNIKSIAYKYKNIKFIGNKFNIKVNKMTSLKIWQKLL